MKRIGIYNASMTARGGGEKKAVVLAQHLSQRYDVSLLVSEAIDVPSIERYFSVDLSRVSIVVVGESPQTDSGAANSFQRYVQNGQALTARFTNYRKIRDVPLDLFINNAISSKMICPVSQGVFMCMFPHLPRRRAESGAVNAALHSIKGGAASLLLGRHTEAYDSYSVVTANSEYTSEWVKKWWGRDAEVVYSVCDPLGLSPNKEKIILHVGRFAADVPDSNYKCQDALLETFQRMTRLHKAGWHLHFVGSLPANDPPAARLVEELRARAAGYPVTFHINASGAQVQSLNRRASIYWHATGFGYPENKFPGRQEHFGISTVEAMSTGAVPVVINSGGQRETVQHGQTGLLWDDLKGLIHYTEKVIDAPDLWRRLSHSAAASCDRYTRAAFNARMDRIVDSLLS